MVVTITNKGDFGLDMAYRILVGGLGEGDHYEPDYTARVAIASAARRRACSTRRVDVDRVYFQAQPGIPTWCRSGYLATAMDTLMSVNVGGGLL